MKALTIRQPWAGMVMEGNKKIENRGWETDYRGPLLIHTGTKKPHSSWLEDDSDEQDGSGYLVQNETLRYASGVILGTVELVDILTRKEALKKFPKQKEFMEQKIIVGPYCWIFENPKVFKKFIPCKGQLKLWNYDAPTEK
jgi:hypothetical protein